MGSVFRRYPNLNRGLVLLVTLVLPPATAAAVLHALSQERPALVAPRNVEARPTAGITVQTAEEETADETLEPAAPAAALPTTTQPQPLVLASTPVPAGYPVPTQSIRDALLISLSPRAPPA
ncbi:MAG: hypothetical protein QM758_21645 [Armatimonas sp.]